MNRSAVTIVLVMGVLTLMLWAIVNRPGIEPPWPAQIAGFAFSPIRDGQDPTRGQYPTVADIDNDLALLAGDVREIRTYTVSATMAEVPRLAAVHDIDVSLGAWLGSREDLNDKEIERLIDVVRKNPEQVSRVIIGNEALLREDLDVRQMIARVQQVQRAVSAPVSTAEPWHIWLENPQLVDAVDYIAVHLLPYWEGVAVDRAVDYVLQRYRELQRAYPDKLILVTEVGWPSNGRTMFDAVATAANQARFLRRFIAAAEREGLTYFLMEAFDQPWKQVREGEAGAHWGVYDADREQKFAFVSPIVPIPNWTALATTSIGLAVILLAFLLRDSQGLSMGGSGFLAAIAYGTTTFVVWLLYDFTQQYMSLGMIAVTITLLLSALAIITLLLAEAHEWAEALWLRQWRRQPSTAQHSSTPQRSPRVSVHVPTFNEPAEMVIATLDSLARLDYPDYEVVVVDNNTPDPAVWRPVEAHCRRLGSHFRFFHVAPLQGFKAGALNYALKKSDPAAEIVAVIDADYQVSENWLRDLAPLFADPELAIVQAPQDYRDGHESLFKAMCQSEYLGFFRIGMVTRNERDAIIQHGTMTLVRRSTLEAVDGWSEWCITEDAELGLKVFEQGPSAIYTSQTYGRGLVPDNFLDFKKQRFRWAYGAVRILRAHLPSLLGLQPSALTPGQRYHFIAGWLPWLGDGFNLLFNLAALAWTAAMVIAPEQFAPPHPVFVALPLTLFTFKLLKLFSLYRWRIGASFRESLAAGLAGLSLSHIIGRATLTGLVDSGVGFFRTPKKSQAHGVLAAFHAAREELLFGSALVLGGIAVVTREDGQLFDVQLWSTMLTIQAIPYAASVLVSLISAAPALSGRLLTGVRGVPARS
jgi:exo-beta-1,3-glucanase (GH17 family)/cellulose synthase/poly-beta-1,6-N-acetylglucosamine synthase-like glycosyltransferase